MTRTYPHIALVFLVILFSACQKNDKQQFEHAGGALTMALNNELATYQPRAVLDYYSAAVLYQINEGLVGMDPENLKIIPKLASDWTVGNNGKTYTFTLRENVLFHPCELFTSEEDRKFTPDDVIASFEAACRKDENGLPYAAYSLVFKSLVKGADEFYNGESESISGLQVNGNEITIELIREDQNFLYKLANINAGIVSKKVLESAKDNEIVIGTGPFVYGDYTGKDVRRLILLKNKDYYRFDDEGNSLPYLDSIVLIFEGKKMNQLELFENEEIDLIKGLPTTRITKMLEGRIEDFNSKPPKLILENNPLLESNFYYFNLQDPRFKDKRVRQAFNYAVDKEVIGREILRNQYYDLGWYGLTPPIPKALKGYDFATVKKAGYTYDPEKAKKLLADAGYPNGEGFGTVQLRYNINDIHSAVADEFAKQIKTTLDINVNIDGSTFEQLIEDGEFARGDIFRQGWGGDYPSPETFLATFYGAYVPDDSLESSMINKSRYKNPLFDEFFKRGTDAKKMSDQMANFAKAEAELMKDPPIIPLWYTGDIEIIQSYVRNFHFNPLNYMDFTKVYIKEWTEEEYTQLQQSEKK